MSFALRAKSGIKKIAALSAGTVMLGATLTGAIAQPYNLADYPAPFVSGGQFDMLPVFGDTAAASDVSGAWDILSGLYSSAGVGGAGTGTGGAQVVVVGGETDEIPLNTSIASSGFIDAALDDSDLENFIDTEITFAGSSYNVHDELDLGSVKSGSPDGESVVPRTSLTSSAGGEDDYESNVFLEVSKSQISYYYVFDETINMNDTSTTDPLEVLFLGKKLKIVEVTSTSSFKAHVGDEYFMNVGDKVTSIGKTVTLENVGQSAVLIDVDGVKSTIQNGATETVNGVEVTVDELFYRTQIESSSATLVVGKDSSEEIKHDEDYFGGDDNCLNNNPDDPDCWEWVIGELYQKAIGDTNRTTGGPTIGLTNDFNINDDNDNPPTVGDCMNLPNNYASICFDSLTVADTDYNTYTIEFESSADLSNVVNAGSSEPVIKIKSENDEDGLKIRSGSFNNTGSGFTDGTTTDVIYLHVNTSSGTIINPIDIFYEDADNKVQWAGSMLDIATEDAGNDYRFAEINFEDTKSTNIELDIAGVVNMTDTINITFDVLGDEAGQGVGGGMDDLSIKLKHTATDFDGFGRKKAESESDELYWGPNVQNNINNGNAVALGKKDEDHRTSYGIIIRDPESNLDSDQLVFEIPADQVKANIVIKGTTTQVTSTGIDGTGVVRAVAPSPVLASQVSVPESDNLMIIGGPAVNTLAERFLGVTQATWPYASGQAIIELKDNGANVALVVAGTDALDTRRAAVVLRDFSKYGGSLVGRSVLVTGTSAAFTDIKVESV